MIAVDPGVNNCGMAIFGTDGVLIWAGYSKPYKQFDYSPVIIEVPQIYQGRKQKGDPNDLIDLAVEVGRIIGINSDLDHELVKPRVWKGQVPKAVMTKRILSKLDKGELFVLGPLAANHNVVDAVGIGLWKLGRL